MGHKSKNNKLCINEYRNTKTNNKSCFACYKKLEMKKDVFSVNNKILCKECWRKML